MEELLRRDADVIVAEVDGKAMLLNLRTWIYLSLNDTADRIWDHLAPARTGAELLVLLLQEFDAPEEEIAADLEAFLRELRTQEFIAEAQW